MNPRTDEVAMKEAWPTFFTDSSKYGKTTLLRYNTEVKFVVIAASHSEKSESNCAPTPAAIGTKEACDKQRFVRYITSCSTLRSDRGRILREHVPLAMTTFKPPNLSTAAFTPASIAFLSARSTV